ncbi:hypothetical protein EF888_07325 [Silicimonas algicola]|uniref:Uncharacterized protein n=1 Tax=Silicimonas algicola TaxID=1826607 RepID=A0A316G3R7_9RHOB|nr:hypothetical protein [Silicimonas algicola]AZQ66963.1 hypothetical protein EF888_07325 [Silicimonas algicola]PWK55529.1 hypothetical protein C8D95_107195 [Silicimonas algicola]
MTQTRGKPALAFTHNGGFVRDILPEHIEAAYIQAYDEIAPPTFVSEAANLLRFRIVDVDNPRKRFTEADIKKVRDAAKRLRLALLAFPDQTGLLQSLEHRMKREVNSGDLHTWVALLERSDTARPYQASRSFKWAISELAKFLRAEGKSPARNGTGPFFRLVEGIERQYPGLMFPTETVGTGRQQYISRALK